MRGDSNAPSFLRVIGNLIGIWGHLSASRKRQFLLLGLLMVAGGVAEAASLGAVLPFLAVIASPEKISAAGPIRDFLMWVQHVGGAGEAAEGDLALRILPFLAALLVVVAFLSAGVRLLLVWQSSRLANLAGAEISVELYRRILDRPYILFTSGNSATLISNIAAKNGLVVISLTALLTLMVSVVMVSAIFFALLWIQPWVTVLAGVLVGSFYGLSLAWSRAEIQARSAEISAQQDAIYLKLQEGLGGIRDIILDGAQDAYARLFRKSIFPLRLAFAKVSYLSQSPRYVVETLALVLFVGLAWWAQVWGPGASALLPYLGALALGAQRLLPALQQGYAAWSTMLGYEMVTRDALAILEEPRLRSSLEPKPACMPLRAAIRFESVSFRYSDAAPWVLRDLSFTVPKGSRVGLIGKTGSGKSTCLDLLMGLLQPTAGRILIDETILTQENMRAWQQNIAHVPQAIFLSDSNFAENIAFGVPPSEVNPTRVQNAARQAQISEFIESTPAGYLAPVGERGIRLSGGQRQRVGIARALYKQAQVLVFDEATSALDDETEAKVTASIETLSPDLTVLIIAHRVSTLRKCDFILQFQDGKAQIMKSLPPVLTPPT